MVSFNPSYFPGRVFPLEGASMTHTGIAYVYLLPQSGCVSAPRIAPASRMSPSHETGGSKQHKPQRNVQFFFTFFLNVSVVLVFCLFCIFASSDILGKKRLENSMHRGDVVVMMCVNYSSLSIVVAD